MSETEDTPTAEQLELGAEIAAIFYSFQVGERPGSTLYPNEGELAMAVELLVSEWLVKHDAEKQDEAWQVGFDSGVRAVKHFENGSSVGFEKASTSPYKKLENDDE